MNNNDSEFLYFPEGQCLLLVLLGRAGRLPLLVRYWFRLAASRNAADPIAIGGKADTA
jgi:hypothetical protein